METCDQISQKHPPDARTGHLRPAIESIVLKRRLLILSIDEGLEIPGEVVLIGYWSIQCIFSAQPLLPSVFRSSHRRFFAF